MSSSSPTASVYPLPPGETGYEPPYRYEDAQQPAQPPRPLPPPTQAYQEQQPEQPIGQDTPPQSKQPKSSGETKPRLRKACDSCSVRKVKVRH